MPTQPFEPPDRASARAVTPWVLLGALGLACSTPGAAGPTSPTAQSSVRPTAAQPPADAAGEAHAPATAAGSAPPVAPAGEPPRADAAQAAPPEAAPEAPPAEPLPLPPGTKVLQVGDSFAGALGLPLGALLEQAGVRSVLKHKDASYLTTWAWEPDLAQEIWRYNPDLVVITLGANELGIAEPAQRAKTVRKIVSTVGERPCLWVAIPLWSERHNGLLDVIEANSQPCVFYDTNERLDTLAMPRIHDGIHPTTSARTAWAEAVFDFLQTHRRPREGAPWSLVD